MPSFAPCNTPQSQDPVTVGLHHLEFRVVPTGPIGPALLALVEHACEEHTGVTFEPAFKRGLCGYHKSKVHRASGALLGIDAQYPLAGQHDHVGVRFTGRCLESLSLQQVWSLLTALQATGDLYPSRLDLAFDHAPVTPHQLYDAVLSDDIKTSTHRSPDGTRHHTWMSNPDGQSLYIGSKTSERCVLIYNRRGYSRIEARFRRSYAERVFHMLANAGWTQEALCDIGRGLVLDIADFRHRDPDAPNGWGERLPGWDAFAEDALAIKPPAIVKHASLKTKRSAVFNYARLIALVAHAEASTYGSPEAFLRSLLRTGEGKLTNADLALLDQLNDAEDFPRAAAAA